MCMMLSHLGTVKGRGTKHHRPKRAQSNGAHFEVGRLVQDLHRQHLQRKGGHMPADIHQQLLDQRLQAW